MSEEKFQQETPDSLNDSQEMSYDSFSTEPDRSGPQVGPDTPREKQSLLDQQTPFTQEQITERQKDWQRFEEQEDDYQHNQFPHYFYAGFWIRFFAFCLDLLCIQAITSGTVGLVYRLRGLTPESNFLSIYGLASLLIYLLYFILLTKLNKGQTIGKMVFGIRVVSLDQAELSWTTVLVREGACRFILKGFPFILGYLPAAFSNRKQHVGDYFSNTAVVTLNLIKAFNKEVKA